MEGTQRSIERTASYDGLDFTVHNFIPPASTAPRKDLLALGQKIIQSAKTSPDWFGPKAIAPLNFSTRLFSYAVVPPVILPQDGTPFMRMQEDLKEWGSPVEESEVYCIENLEEFVNSDFSSLFRVKEASHETSRFLDQAWTKQDLEASLLGGGARVLQGPQSGGMQGVQVEIPQLTPSNRKVTNTPVVSQPDVVIKDKDLDRDPLYHVISQPHIHPSLLPKKPPRENVKGYAKTTPIPIPPHVRISSPSPYDRSAWLIPIRGKLPWEACTSAAILAPSRRVPIPPDPSTNDNQITWSHDALQRFWKFILSLRDAGSLGTIGISFHAAPPSADFTALSYSYSTPSGVGAQVIQRDTLPSHPSSRSGHSTPSTTMLFDAISSVDHMKIFHEGPRRMIFRTALDIWRYEADAKDGSEKVRLLKGAKLVLLDHRSRGLLIS